MKQREIWLADLNPVKGNEQQGIRPVVVISGNAMNDHLGISIVCPLTSRIKNYSGCLVLERNPSNGLSTDSEVITFQVRTLSRERFRTRLGEISGNQLKVIINGLSEILTY
ncbi:MAG TPA: type II toxin-antitoxin system PemK/MazF family toxin [Prolixibacteraceae bacterium]|nr:type II toxin-antitoxin system PemK/MazF family toxin [Prolixibacteraceae bacterium]HRV89872.1 type II toxin-antitoxin system PemK/MazF family toxin [Prolixibacteraceae bacterium]